MVSLLLTLNTCNILHDVKNTEKGALYWKKNKSNNFERLQIEVFFHLKVIPPSLLAPTLSLGIYTHCLYISISGILRCLTLDLGGR